MVSLLVDNGDLVSAVFPFNQKALFGVASRDFTDPMPPCVTLTSRQTSQEAFAYA